MTRLVWDQVGERQYETGVDHGVLYLSDGSAVPWNGLLSVTDDLTDASVPYFLDGVKYLDSEIFGDAAVTLQAFTYPDEFQPHQGMGNAGNGLFVGDQKPQTFGLSYRTKAGDDVTGYEAGYKIHILYNLTASAETIKHESISDSITPITFSWKMSTTPEAAPGFRPTAHIVLDSRELDPDALADIENFLYGTVSTDPAFPTIADLYEILTAEFVITIIDNGDGTWTAIGNDQLITMLDATTFQITDANAVYLDADTYEISTTELY